MTMRADAAYPVDDRLHHPGPAPLEPGALIAALGYWRDTLAGLPAALALPADRCRERPAARVAERIDFEIDPARHAALRRLAATHGATMFEIVHAALAIVLGGIAAQHDLAIGTPGRAGAAANRVVLRTDLSGNPSTSELLRRVRTADRAALACRPVPFAPLAALLAPESGAVHPLFQVMLAVGHVGDDLSWAAQAIADGVELAFALRDSYGALSGAIFYAEQWYDRETIEAIRARLWQVLDTIAADPSRRFGDMPLLIRDDCERLRAWMQAPGMPAPAPACGGPADSDMAVRACRRMARKDIPGEPIAA
ncbi:hypothetical protein EFP18_26825 [Burkholderia glumae]|uniref:condensation domain-containing protein n=2 Tax=Burkholderia glumae TaxID=337 RepID=UPI000F5E8C98|nr:condensation domain-containing protein [Burkholderia glumae]QJW81640.1 hypothetical protein GAS18_23760 [Burkholderia glumae]RQZ67145.1 hypothetical protein DF052_24790 [Burkholderia glumae]UVS87627.1 hypothetical protein EFP18_26825 [Burkholderia glumae]UVS99323.1 hypothetical protein EFP19_27490 [Burkholderia glumae]